MIGCLSFIGLIIILSILLCLFKRFMKRGKKYKDNLREVVNKSDFEEDDDIEISKEKLNNIPSESQISSSIDSINCHQDISLNKIDQNSNSPMPSLSQLNSQNSSSSQLLNPLNSQTPSLPSLNNINSQAPSLPPLNHLNGNTQSLPPPLNPLNSQMPYMNSVATQDLSNYNKPLPTNQQGLQYQNGNYKNNNSLQANNINNGAPVMNNNNTHSNYIRNSLNVMPSPMNYNNNGNGYMFKNTSAMGNRNNFNGNAPTNNYHNMTPINNNPEYMNPPPPPPTLSNNQQMLSNEAQYSSMPSVPAPKYNDESTQNNSNNSSLPSYINSVAQKVKPNEHVFVAQYYYNPKFNDEFQISPGDVISFGNCTYDDGWAHGSNLTKDTTGVFPLGVVIKIVDVDGKNRDTNQSSEKYKCKPRSSSHTVKYQASTSEKDPTCKLIIIY